MKLRIRTLGLVYLARQNKILALPPSEQEEMDVNEVESAGAVEQELKNLVREGLERLAGAARKAIRDKEFVKRRSNY